MCVCMHVFKLLLTFSCKLSSDTIILPEVYQMEGFLNWIKIERMLSNYFCSCNLEQLKMSLKKSGTRTYTHIQSYTHIRTHTVIHTHAHTHAHTHIHMCILTSWTKAMVRKTRCPEPGLKMLAYTKRVNKTIKSFKRSTTHYTKADNILYSNYK